MQTKVNVPIALRNISRMNPAERQAYYRRTMAQVAFGEWFTGDSPDLEERKLALQIATCLDAVDHARKIIATL
jgi:hypothetical protein